MFREIYQLLSMDNYFGVSEEIEVLKGKYEKPSGLKESIKKRIRKSKFKK